MNKYPKISIITPTLNSEEYLEQSILSVIGQTYPNVEYIIIDGGSTDRTLQIVDRYKKNITRFVSEKDNGTSDAINKGIRLATGDVILFLGSDDFLYKNEVLEEASEYFRTDSNLYMVYGKAMFMDPITGFSTSHGKKIGVHDLENWVMSPFPAFFIKRDLYFEFGLLDLGYKSAHDFDFIIKCFKFYEDRSLFIDRIISVFRLGGMSTSKKNRDVDIKEADIILKKHFGHGTPKLDHTLTPAFCFKLWIERLTFGDKPITEPLIHQGIRNIAIFGTDKLAVLLAADSNNAGINVVSYLDNSAEKHGYAIKGREIYSPKWLSQHHDQIDAVIVSIEGTHDTVIAEELKKLLPPNSQLRIMTWKKLLEDQFDYLL